MADELKKYIEQHRNEFDDEKAPLNLWSGIESKMTTEKKQGLLINIARSSLRIAASVLVLIISGFFWIWLNADEAQVSDQIIAKHYPELKETELYYNQLIEKQMQLVNQDTPHEGQKFVQDDLKELEQIYKELKNDLKDQADNEQVILAMIENYRTRIKILETLLEKESTTQTNTENEQAQDL